MFDQLVRRSNAAWIYTTGRFAEERRIFLEEMTARGYGLRALRIINPILLAVAEGMNIRRPGSITEMQIVRAAENWVQKRSAPVLQAKPVTQRRNDLFMSPRNWFRFRGKRRDADRNPQFKPATG